MTPAGLFWTMAASPSLPVVPWADTRARPLAVTKRREECIVALEFDFEEAMVWIRVLLEGVEVRFGGYKFAKGALLAV